MLQNMLRRSLINYLNNTFPLVTVTNLPKFDKVITPLFSIYNRDDNYYLSLNIDYHPCLYLLKYIQKIDYKFKLENNNIPLRWYYILQEFYLPELKFVIQPCDYSEKVNQLTDLVIENIVCDATQINHIKYSKVIVKDENWITLDNARNNKNDVVNRFFEKSAYYKSLDGSYSYLYACEGGIEFNNSYVDDFVRLNHSQLGVGSIRNETKGHNRYSTGKDITPEELMVLHLIMKKEGIDNEFVL